MSLFSSCWMAGSLHGMAIRNRVSFGGRWEKTDLSAIRSHNFSLRWRVRFPVPNPCLDSLLSVDQGAVREKNADSSSRALSQVTHELIAWVLGHLTQNHDVVSSRSPRMKGSQFSSSVGGMRSGLVRTPEQRPLFFITLQGSSCQHTDRPLATRVIFLGQPMCALVNEIRCVDNQMQG